MKLTMLGTGNALVTECYNTCFVLSDEYGHFLVDSGGYGIIMIFKGMNYIDKLFIYSRILLL